jgi:hypothetical protein
LLQLALQSIDLGKQARFAIAQMNVCNALSVELHDESLMFRLQQPMLPHRVEPAYRSRPFP